LFSHSGLFKVINMIDSNYFMAQRYVFFHKFGLSMPQNMLFYSKKYDFAPDCG